MKILDEDLKLCKSKTDDGEQLVWLPCCVDFGSRRTVRVYVSTVLFYFLSLNGNVFLVHSRALEYNKISFFSYV